MRKQIPHSPPSLPSATYRLQFNSQFRFEHATGLIAYLRDLGITDIYASPIFTARHGSPHGYDITDHSSINPELGGKGSFREFAHCLRQNEMGLILDVVPNHMCIGGSTNPWWNDVLENGPSSPFAPYFDIDWHPPKPDLTDKVLLPVLGNQFGRVLDAGEIAISYERGGFFANYYDTRLPLAPRSYPHILGPMLGEIRQNLGEQHPKVLELESIITAIDHLPLRNETYSKKIRERQREKEIIKQRIHTLCAECSLVESALANSLKELNGDEAAPGNFDRLERLLVDQGYRLSFWRVAADEINYRRFFDINELAAIRVEDPRVFKAVHGLILELISQGVVTGLRIDHVDGLFEPYRYLIDLQAACQAAQTQSAALAISAASLPAKGWPGAVSGASDRSPFYIIVEKILSHTESMRLDWPVHGTTGYGFLNYLNGVFIDRANEPALRNIYRRITGQSAAFSDLIYECKKLIMRVAMSSELEVLARRLDRISEQHRYWRDFTLNSLQYALAEVIACFPVYRSYTTKQQREVGEEDRRHILAAIHEAMRRNPATSPSIFDFIRQLLLLEDPPGLNHAQREERRDFILRLQQFTGPVMAKGVEDTAFYRHYPLASLNEVGGEPMRFGVSLNEFHDLNLQRMIERPHGLSATSTHDTKRGEDVRARINVLSEIASKWYRALYRWRNHNRVHKVQIEGTEVPGANEEYLLYQTLVGIWPLEPLDADKHADLVRRLKEYLIKATREAKVHTSWISPNEAYEAALQQFIEKILAPVRGNRFLKSFVEFQASVAHAGMFNSLSQTLLKITAPGVPDFYQGSEIWDFSLVDPDNRRPVDFERRRQLLASLPAGNELDLPRHIARLLAQPQDGRIKLHLISRALRFRNAHLGLFSAGEYVPLIAEGAMSNHVLAFLRRDGQQTAVTLCGRFFTRLGDVEQLPTGPAVWGDTRIRLDRQPASSSYRDVLTGQPIQASSDGNGAYLSLSEVFAHLPVALLEQVWR